MNFGLLGDDAATLPLLRAISAHAEHRLTHAAFVGDLLETIVQSSPEVRILSGWEHLLLEDGPKAVIICGSDPQVIEASKQLATAGKPLLLYPRSEQGSTLIYELTIIRDDAGTVLVPALPRSLDPRIAAIASHIRTGAMGSIHHLQVEHEIKTAIGAGPSNLIDSAAVETTLLHDIDLLRVLTGKYEQITSVYTGMVDNRVGLATVALAGANVPQVSWTAKPVSAAPHWKLTLHAEHGPLVISGNDDPDQLTVTGNSNSEGSNAATTYDSGSALLSHFTAAIAGSNAHPNWNDLMRAVEIVEAGRQSRRRRRTIDVHFETTSERSLFKTQMTAIGCGLLSFTFFAFLLLLLVAGAVDPRSDVEARSEAAGFIIYVDEFVANEGQLAAAGSEHVKRIAEKLSDSRADILVEQSGRDSDNLLDQGRRQVVVEQLVSENTPDAAARVRILELRGKWYQPVMSILRVLVFLPLALFLGLQLLLFLARPSTSRRSEPPA